MKISDIGEFGLIRNIQKLATRPSPFTIIGIGDDAAVLRLSRSAALLATTDMLLEHVHFDLSTTDFFSLGWKSAAANLSDIAAMGGKPRFLLSALGIPAYCSAEQIRDFYRGVRALADAHHTVLVGGDTCRSKKGLVISITALGEVSGGSAILRSHARPGDAVFVSGTLGDSAAGMELLRTRGRRKAGGERRLVQKHLRPEPRVEAGQALARAGCVSAMIDISDGLSSDMGHLCEQSRVGAEIFVEGIPLSRDIIRSSGRLKAPLAEYALHGGEDYELLFTVPLEKKKKLMSLGLPVTEIGRIIRGRKQYLTARDGTRSLLTPRGYDHFRP